MAVSTGSVTRLKTPKGFHPSRIAALSSVTTSSGFSVRRITPNMWTGGTSPNAYTTGGSLAAGGGGGGGADSGSAPVVVVALVAVQAISGGAAVAVVFQR